MEAVVFTEQGEALADRPEPTTAPDELLLRVEYCGICGSDLHAGLPDFRPGTIMGHEFSATVSGLGSQVQGFRVGDRVVINPNGDWCGRCPACTSGATNMCVDLLKNSIGLARNGGLAPIAAVRARTAHHLPESVDLATGAWVEPLAVALRAVRNSGFTAGHDAVVFGGGPIGLLVTSVLSASGAQRIWVVEPTPARRQMASRQGATDVLDPTTTSIDEYFADLPSDPGYAFECSGVAELVGQAVRVLGPRGTLTVTGFSRRPPTFDAADLLQKEIVIRGSFIYVDEFPAAIDFLGTGKVDVRPLISGVVPVAKALDAFSTMRTSPDTVKYLISNSHD